MISVIIPVHNGIRTLDRAVGSVLRQTVRGRGEPVEVILVDDGSSEETARRCDELAEMSGAEDAGAVPEPASEKGKPESRGEEGHVIRAFHMEDRGVSAARNLGLEKARGEFITFLDDDDAMEPGMLEFLLALHEKTGAEICGCGFRPVRPEEIRAGAEETPSVKDSGNRPSEAAASSSRFSPQDPGPWGNVIRKARVFCGPDIVTKRILQRDTRVWSKLFTREVIGDRRFLEGLTIGEDMLFVLTLVGEKTRYAASDKPLYDYTINPKGAMERPFTKSYMDQIRCWDEADNVIRRNLPAVLGDEEAAASLGALRVVSDVLTASKIARLPDTQWKEYQTEFQQCRERLREHETIPGSMERIPKDYSVKARMLLHWPGLYRMLYRGR